MAKAQNKTQPTTASVDEHLNAIDNDIRVQDCRELVAMMRAASGCEPVMWGAIVGFGQYHYRYDSGREGDFMRIGFANRKTALTLYIMSGFDAYPDLLAKLGKFKTGKSCLYIKKLSDVDTEVLGQLISESLQYMAHTYGPE